MKCPNCTTELDRVNAGRAICPNCDTEYFISEHAIYPQFGEKETKIILEEWPSLPEAPDPPKNPMKMVTIQTPYHEDIFAPYMAIPVEPPEARCQIHLPLDNRCILCGEEAK